MKIIIRLEGGDVQQVDVIHEAADVDAGREGRRIGVEVQTRDYDRDSVASCDQSNYYVDGAGEAYVLRHPEIIELATKTTHCVNGGAVNWRWAPMGYTHYWRFPEQGLEKGDRDRFRVAVGVIKKYWDKIVERAGCKIVREYDRPKTAPHLDPVGGEIAFNGLAHEGHESFVVDCTDQGFLFCKTAQKPYDFAVMVCLLVIKAHLGDKFKLSSDGSFDEEWSGAIEFVSEVIGVKPVIHQEK